jgi:Flp pilus assembly protein TadG
MSTAKSSPRLTSQRTEHGVTTVEVVVIVPLLMLLFVIFIFTGKMVNMSQRVKEATHDAARAASLQLTQEAARDIANKVMQDNIGTDGNCIVETDPKAIGNPNFDLGEVVVKTTCTMQIATLAPFNKQYSFTSEVREVVDQYRGNINQDEWWNN